MELMPQRYEMHLEAYSHGFRVTRFNDDIRQLLVGFCRLYVKAETNKDRHGRYVTIPDKVFATATVARDQYFFHINVLEEFYKFFEFHRVPRSLIKVTERPMYEPARTALEWINHAITLRDYQNEAVDFVDKEKPRTKMINIQAGQGKALSMDTPVKVPGGWKLMRDIQVNDLVIAKDGTATRVTGVYPQGITPVYRVGFSDGRWVDTCGEHLWKVFNSNTVPNNHWKIRNTLDIAAALKLTRASNRLYIDLADSEIGPDAPLLMDPYALGFLIGDGNLTARSIYFSTGDQFIVDELNKVLPASMEIVKVKGDNYDYRFRLKNDERLGELRNPYRSILIELGLLGKKSHQKFVPESYLNGSTAQRLALLQGLMDSDGTAGTDGVTSFSTVSERLASHVQHLVRSLGGWAKISSRYTQYSHNGEKRTGQLCYKVSIRFKIPSSLFRLPRKKERARDINQYSEDLKLRITSVIPVGEAETQCISVEHPDRLFVIKNFIVTHNTLTLLAYINHAQLRTVLIMKPMYMKQWKKEILECFKINKGDFYIIGGDKKDSGGSKALRALIQLAKEDPDFDPSIIMISNATYRDYLTSFRMNPQQCKDLYGCYPWEFFELMGAGLVAVDEVHQDFHFNFLTHCFSNIYKFAAMSATMKSDDHSMNRFYRIMFPQDTYSPAPPLKKYIDIYEVFYRFDREDKIRYRIKGKYHQATFENSILRQKRVLANYVNMICTMVDHQFFKHKDYRPGMKILVYADRVDMCTEIRDALKAKFPDRKVTRFCATVDKEENLYGESNEVIVTTLKSCGTARDVKDVAVGLATIGISGLQASDQLIHRLREFKRPEWQGITPRFIFLGSRGNDKHLKYAEDRTSKLKHVVKNFNTMTSTFII